jgi:hypothetical protein
MTQQFFPLQKSLIAKLSLPSLQQLFSPRSFQIFASCRNSGYVTTYVLLRNKYVSKTPHNPTKLLNFQLKRFAKVQENNSVFKTHKATRGVVNFYSAGVVTHDRGIGSVSTFLDSAKLEFLRLRNFFSNS